MKRWVWNSVCLFSLLVFVSSVTLWVRSYSTSEDIDRVIRLGDVPWDSSLFESIAYNVMSSRGALGLRHSHVFERSHSGQAMGWTYWQSSSPTSLIETQDPHDRANFQCAGFQLLYRRYSDEMGSGSVQLVVVPLWLFLPTAIPPILWLRRWRKDRRRGFLVSVASAPES